MIRKTTIQRLLSIAEIMELWTQQYITDARAMMMVHGIASAHIHDILMTNVELETIPIDKQPAIDIDIKNIQWKKLEVQAINQN